MAKQTGRLMLVKIGDGEVSEAFTTLGGIRSKTMTINNNSYDVTTPDSTTPGGQLWQEVFTGMRSVEVSGSALFEGGTSLDRLIEVAMGTGQTDTAEAVCNFQVVVPDFGTFEGAFHINSLEYGGEMEGGVSYSISLASSGVISFTEN